MMSAPFHIAIGRLWQETNTFAETRTSLREFRQYTWQIGEEMMPELRAQDNELAGFADVLDAEEVTYVPLLHATAWCGGPLLEEVVTAATDAVVGQLRNAKKLDAILFSLHGAMAGENTFDVEGHLLSTMRKCVGPDVPIVMTLDHHANVTRAIVENADAITAYRHCPHMDMRETGRRGARMLLAMLERHPSPCPLPQEAQEERKSHTPPARWKSISSPPLGPELAAEGLGGEDKGEGYRLKPTMAFRKIPLVTPCEQFRTAEPPMKTWFDLAAEMRTRAGLVDAMPFPVQPWMDVPEFGWSVVVVTDNNQALADNCAAELANWAWEHRTEFYVKKDEPAEAVRRAATAPHGPVVIADGADATNGGSPGDSTCLLREFLCQKITCTALLTMVDPEAVELAYRAVLRRTNDTPHLDPLPQALRPRAQGRVGERKSHGRPLEAASHIPSPLGGEGRVRGVGATEANAILANSKRGVFVTVSLGAKRSRKYHQPIEVTARVGRFSDGKFNLSGHLAMKVNMGRCVVLEIGSIRVLVSEFAGPGHDPEVFRHIGLEPRDAQIVVVKATVGHMDAYRDIMKENLPTECPGPSPSYLERLDYTRIPRPMYPFDKQMTWKAENGDEPRITRMGADKTRKLSVSSGNSRLSP